MGVDDVSRYVIWTKHFMEAQGYKTKENVIYQDNQSAILLEKNGIKLMGKRSRHINIRYFFIKDRHDKKELTIEYCPMDEMIRDFYQAITREEVSEVQKGYYGFGGRRIHRWSVGVCWKYILFINFIYYYIYIYMMKTRIDQFKVKI